MRKRSRAAWPALPRRSPASSARELGAPAGRVHVILVDQTDLSNGWATPAPYNLIEITAAAPPGDSSIGNTDDWLRLVFAHEYTHIVHLDKARGWIGGLRGVFGRAPVLFPNLFLPLWQIEGIATYNESALTGEGRVPAGDFRMIVDRAAAAGRFDPIDRANGGLVDWPGGAAQYAYGAYFHQYLADRFGPESLVRLSEETARRVPYFGAPAFRKVFGRSLGTLWDDFNAATRSRRSADPQRVNDDDRDTADPSWVLGERAQVQRSGRLFYAIANPHGFPALMELPRDGSAPRQVTTKYLGGQIAAAGGRLVFDQAGARRERRPAVRSVFRPRRTAAAHDASPAARAQPIPTSLRTGAPIVCTVQSADRRALATLALDHAGGTTQPAPLISEVSTNFSSPRWSPDGRSIAAERRVLGGPSEIVVVDSATGQARAARGVCGRTQREPVLAFGRQDDSLRLGSGRETVRHLLGRGGNGPDAAPERRGPQRAIANRVARRARARLRRLQRRRIRSVFDADGCGHVDRRRTGSHRAVAATPSAAAPRSREA